MTDPSADDVMHMILEFVARKNRDFARGSAEAVDGLNLLGAGVLDSLGFVHLIAELETRLRAPIDLTDLDPELLTVVGPLSRHLAARCGSR